MCAFAAKMAQFRPACPAAFPADGTGGNEIDLFATFHLWEPLAEYKSAETTRNIGNWTQMNDVRSILWL